jgi:hypothetical protein
MQLKNWIIGITGAAFAIVFAGCSPAETHNQFMAATMTPPQMVVGGGESACLEYLNEKNAQLRITPEQSNGVLASWVTDPDWNLVDLNSGYTQKTPTITYQSFDGNTHRLALRCTSTPIGTNHHAYFVIDDKRDPNTTQFGFRGIDGKNYVSGIGINADGWIAFYVVKGP